MCIRDRTWRRRSRSSAEVRNETGTARIIDVVWSRSKQDTLVLPVSALALLILGDYKATSGWNWHNWMLESKSYGVVVHGSAGRFFTRNIDLMPYGVELFLELTDPCRDSRSYWRPKQRISKRCMRGQRPLPGTPLLRVPVPVAQCTEHDCRWPGVPQPGVEVPINRVEVPRR